jgi:hypothetical protein
MERKYKVNMQSDGTGRGTFILNDLDLTNYVKGVVISAEVGVGTEVTILLSRNIPLNITTEASLLKVEFEDEVKDDDKSSDSPVDGDKVPLL